jgi:predicted nicotinamide N-methyase
LTDRYSAFVRAEAPPSSAALVPEIALHLATEVTPLWQATEASLETTQLPPPFWAFAWPGGQALARLLLDRPELARGRNVLDFAAGCGIAGIAAALSGAATVTCSEIDAFAVAALRLNSALNHVTIEIAEHDVLAAPARGYALILAGDVCYERPMAERTIAWLTAAVESGAEVLLADPGRSYLPSKGLTKLAAYDVATPLDLESRTMMTTTVYRLDSLSG